MFISTNLPQPSLLKVNSSGMQWTVLQILETVLPDHFDCLGERYFIKQSKILKLDFNRDVLQSMFNEIISAVLFQMGSKEALKVFNCLQPLLMESLFLEGYSVGLKDFYVPMTALENLPMNIEKVSRLLHQLRSKYNELVELQVGNDLRSAKAPVVNFILKLSGLGNLIDSKSESSINKVVEQIGFLGLQLADRGKFYSNNLVRDMTSLFLCKYAVNGVNYPSEAFGLIKSCFFHGLNPYESLVHSISSREVLVRSSRGLTEPGTLFKNLMTILRDVVICYDGTVRNVCSNSIIQFEYGLEVGSSSDRFYPAGEPVGALAATAISNPSYKAVLDSSSSSNTSWELMKEVLVCKVNFMNDLNDRRVILYLNDCCCVKKHCKENAAYLVQNQLKRVSLRDIAVNFLIEYQNQQTSLEAQGANSRLVGHIHLDKKCLVELDRSMHELLLRCREMIGLSLSRRSRKSTLVDSLKNILLSVSECCCFEQSSDSKRSRWCQLPCLQFSWRLDMSRYTLETTSQIMANTICPFLLDTIIKGDRRVTTANIIWISPDTTTWVTNNSKTHNGELAVEVVLEKKFIKKHGDAWRLALDSCLPVMHLIDTTRSIPYAIRQVQEIIGISCAFDQAVQRLSTSIKMVSKGVLKEHLILAVNSMTCTGSLIGFNKGGYKALFRSLNVQLPFTEATLFTPRKCFERAAEKCHTDTLSGIVASCSWGKHVAVGSGTRFEILWNKKEMGSENNGAIDIYSFLQLVRTGSTGGESNTSCLGEDYDELEFENRNADLSLSPEHNFDHSKPTFDDADLQCGFDEDQTADKGNSWESNWEKGVSEVKSGGSSDWKVDEHGVVENGLAWDKPNDSSAWGSAKEPVDAWGSAKEPVDAWGKQTSESQQAKPNDSSAWGASTDASWNVSESEKLHPKEPTDVWGAQKLPSKEPTNAWGSAKEPVDAWGKQTSESQRAKPNDSSAWGASTDASWNISESKKATQRAKPNDSSAWGASADASWNISESKKLPSKEPTDVWGEQKLPSKEPTNAWGKQTEESDATGWDKNLNSTSQGWESEANGWDKKTVSNDSSTDAVWTTSESHKLPPKPVDATQTTSMYSRPKDSSAWGASADAGWNKSESEKFPSSEPADAWGKQKLPSRVPTDGWKKQTTESDGWGASGDAGWNRSESEKLPSSEPADAWGKKKLPSKVPTDGWEKQTNESDTTGRDKNLNPGSLGWDSPSGKDWTKNGTTQDEQERASPHDTWGKNAEEKETSGGWYQHEQGDEPTSSHGRNSQSATGWNTQEEHQDEPENELPCNNWGKKAETKSSGDWSQPTGSQGWDSPSATEWQNGHSQTEKERNSSWGRGKKQSGRGWGSSNSGDWKQNSRPAKSPGRFDDRNARGNFPPTRPKFEQYTSEEQKILSDMEPILQSLRRIMHQSGYNDGDPLSADDQSFVLDNVFNYHPDKAVKMGLGVDHVMISKHSSFQDTRCFYIVSTDGRKEDFSYRKCLENFVKEKYPEIAVSFIGKYFSRKPRNRWGSEQDGSTSQPDAAATSQPDAAAASQP